jgi:hypothetical protein
MTTENRKSEPAAEPQTTSGPGEDEERVDTRPDGDALPLERERRVDPQRLLRIAGVTREVLEEARRIRPVPGAVEHLKDGLNRINAELREALPGELYEELDDLTPEIRSGTLEELALAHAEILGWMEGLFQGTQLALQLQAAQAFQERSGRRLPGPDDRRSEPDSRYL